MPYVVGCADDFQTSQLLSLLLELLGFCIEHHSYHSKNYVMNKDLLRRIVVLLKSRHSFLSLGTCALVNCFKAFFNVG